jgi:biopolymer transport protein ExbD
MTPMIDVVFLLIIFFLVSSHLAKQETRLPVDLPVANTALPDDLDIAPLTIHVDARSRLFIASRETDLPSLREAVREYKESSNQPSVRIRTDRSVPYQSIEPILREAAEAGVTDIRIAVLAEESR